MGSASVKTALVPAGAMRPSSAVLFLRSLARALQRPSKRLVSLSILSSAVCCCHLALEELRPRLFPEAEPAREPREPCERQSSHWPDMGGSLPW